MKEYQFEEITFWFSIIACILAYDAGLDLLWKVLAFESVFILISMIVHAWKEIKKGK